MEVQKFVVFQKKLHFFKNFPWAGFEEYAMGRLPHGFVGGMSRYSNHFLTELAESQIRFCYAKSGVCPIVLVVLAENEKLPFINHVLVAVCVLSSICNEGFFLSSL
ncbi:MAG: hypothetical protein SOZ84_05160 [Treponema sp.]|nr:hypothetical protein [Treponema sp.]